MTRVRLSIVFAFVLAASVTAQAVALQPASVTVGANLETTSSVRLDEAAPSGGLLITLTSNAPSKVLLSTKPDEAGLASITVMVHENFRLSPEFYVQGLTSTGTVTYTASAPGLTKSEGTVTLVPSSIVIGGPFGVEKASFMATTGHTPPRVSVHSVAIDLSGNTVPQPIAGGLTVNIRIASTNETVGTISAPAVTIAGGSGQATTEFQAVTPGNTQLTISVPPGFSVPSQYGTVTATVRSPGISVTGGLAIGQDLMISGVVTLGAPAPRGGAQITLSSDNPKQLVLSLGPASRGASAVTVNIAEGSNNGSYYLHALGNSGTATYSASAPGYLSRTGTITLTPSGLVVVGPLTLPEGQLLRSEAAGGARQHGFVTSLHSGAYTPLSVYTVQLDPTSHRSADITIQALRPDVSVTVDLTSGNPAVGTVGSPVTIAPGSDHAVTQFVPLSTGSTVISLATPAGFVESSNDTALRAIVTQ